MSPGYGEIDDEDDDGPRYGAEVDENEENPESQDEDADGLDEGPEGDGEGGHEGPDEPGQGRRQGAREDQEGQVGRGRASDRIRRQQERYRESERQRLAAEARAAEYERQLAANRPPPETAEQREARYAAMDPMERMEARYRDDMGTMQQQMARDRFISEDRADKADFYNKQPKRLLERYSDEVERTLEEQRRNGTNYTREMILTFLTGRDYMKQASKQGSGKPLRDGKNRLDRETVRPSSSRSDRTNGGSRRGSMSEAEARARRLENMEL